MKHIILLTLMVSIILLFQACKKETEPQTTPTYTNGEGIIGKAGGTITIENPASSLNGVKISIPADALNTEQNIKIAEAPENITFPGDSTQQLIQFLPEGLTFLNPVTIELPYSGNETDNLGIFYFNPENGLISEIELLEVNESHKTISGLTDHFSYYTAWDKSVSMTFNMIKTNTNKIGVRLDVFGTSNNEIGLGHIPTLKKVLYETGNSSALEALLDIDITSIYSVFRIELFENEFLGNTSVASKGLEIWRNMPYGSPAFSARILNNGVQTFESGILTNEDFSNDASSLGIWFSGEPLIFVFDDFVPNPDKKYFVKAGWALSKEENYLGDDNYTNKYFFNNKPNRQKPNEMSQVSLDDIDFNTNFVWDEFELWGNEFSPVCEFEASLVVTVPGQTIYFTDLSNNDPTEWHWDFGDGNTSTLENPEHSYLQTGSYNITLTVSNNYGSDTKIKNGYITVETGTLGEPCPGIPTVTDVDGNTYNTVQIGNQCWMKESLKTGAIVSYANQTDNEIIEHFSYNNYAQWVDTFGGLYQWDEMMNYQTEEGAQGICPEGWHVPTMEEYQQMINMLGGNSIAGAKLKSTTELWYYDDNASNESGFTALPGGYRDQPNFFEGLYSFTYLWTSTLVPAVQAESIGLGSHSEQVFTIERNRNYANYVRCIKNQ